MAASKHMPPGTAAVETICAHTDRVEAAAQCDQVVDIRAGFFPMVAAKMSDAKYEVLAFTGVPRPHWRQISSDTRSG